MIVEWFLGLVMTVAEWAAGLMPQIDLPPWLINVDETINGLLAPLTGMDAWIPWIILASGLTLALGTALVCFVIKVALRVASHIPLFGGAG